MIIFVLINLTMKNKLLNCSAVLILLLFAILFSCKKETPATRYQVVNNCARYEFHADAHVNGTLWSVTTHTYKGTTVISQESLGNIGPDGGTSSIIEVNSGATCVRISFLKDPGSVRHYVVTPADITADELTTVTITDATPTSTILPTQ